MKFLRDIVLPSPAELFMVVSIMTVLGLHLALVIRALF